MVVVNGSGRVADCLAAACHLFRRRIAADLKCRAEKPPSLPQLQIEEVVLEAMVDLGFQNERWSEQLQKCLRYWHLITVFEPSRTKMQTSLDTRIYDAYLAKVILDMKYRVTEESTNKGAHASLAPTLMKSYCEDFSR